MYVCITCITCSYYVCVFGSARSTSDTAGGDRSCLKWNSCSSSVRYKILPNYTTYMYVVIINTYDFTNFLIAPNSLLSVCLIYYVLYMKNTRRTYYIIMDTYIISGPAQMFQSAIRIRKWSSPLSEFSISFEPPISYHVHACTYICSRAPTLTVVIS